MRKTTLFLAVTAFTAVAASSLSAQAVNRKGFYIDGVVNYSAPSNEITDGINTDKDTQGSIGYGLGIGTGLNDQWRIGGQADAYMSSDTFGSGSGIDATVSFYTVAVAFYPSPAKNFWIKANLGYGMESLDAGGSSASAGGFAGGLAVGYDWLLGSSKKFALVPYIAYMDLFNSGDFGGDLSGDGVSAKVGVFQVGIGIGYRH